MKGQIFSSERWTKKPVMLWWKWRNSSESTELRLHSYKTRERSESVILYFSLLEKIANSVNICYSRSS